MDVARFYSVCMNGGASVVRMFFVRVTIMRMATINEYGTLSKYVLSWLYLWELILLS